MKATGPEAASLTVTWGQLGRSFTLTAAIVAGTFKTPTLAPGATLVIRAKVTGGPTTRVITVRSAASPKKVDVVKFQFKAED